MFWKSILEGLLLLGHWEFWAAFFGYMVLFVAFNWITYLVSGKGQNENRGCVFVALFGPFYEGVTIGIFILCLLPTLFAEGGLPPIAAVITSLIFLGIAAFASVVGLFVLSVIPVLGHFMKAMPAAYKFVQGVIIFRIMIAFAEHNEPQIAFPSILALFAYLAIGVLLGGVITTLLGLRYLQPSATEPDEKYTSFMANVGMPAAGSLMGLFPLMMYMAYASLSMGR